MQTPDCDPRRFPNCGPRVSGRRGIFQNIFSFNLCVSFFQKLTEFLGQIPIKLFGTNDLKTEVLVISFGVGAL